MPYMQIRAGDKQYGGGTGLGLTNAKLLVELHGGRIGCISPVSDPAFSRGAPAGSEFFCELPMQLVQSDPQEERPQLAGESAVPSALSSTQSYGSTPNLMMRAMCGDETAQIAVQTADDPTLQHTSASASASASSSAAPLPATRQNIDDDDKHVIIFHQEDSQGRAETEMVHLSDKGPDSGPAHEREGSTVIGSTVSSTSPTVLSPLHTSLPAASSLAVGRSSSSPVGRNMHSAMSPGRRLRCLVVEDSSATRKLLIMLLQSMGCTAEGVEDGLQCVNLFLHWQQERQDAMSAAGSSSVPSDGNPNMTLPQSATLSSSSSAPVLPTCPFDLVLMDSVMPVLSGLEACRMLRSKGITIPIVGATGNALAEVGHKRKHTTRRREAGTEIPHFQRTTCLTEECHVPCCVS
jgi:CheY-like chemotaxis protein